MYLLTYSPQKRTPWNKGKLVGQKPPLKLKEIWAIRIRLQIANHIRDLALFNLQLIASYEVVTWSNSVSEMLPTEILLPKGPWSCNKRRISQFNLR
jgi:hypothetical protein